jgi:catechol 2,3-dioxygenase-like lactoylglutathione lyase family enzyme
LEPVAAQAPGVERTLREGGADDEVVELGGEELADAIETEPTRPNEIGMHRVAFWVDDIDEALAIAARHGCRPLRGVATYEDIYKLSYLRGPSGIIVMLAEELRKN